MVKKFPAVQQNGLITKKVIKTLEDELNAKPFLALPRQLAEPFIKAITKTINNGLDKIPERHKGLVYRNVFLDKEGIAVYQKAFDSSKIHTEKGFMSTTTIKGGVFAGNVSFTVKAKNGAVIEKLSEMADEKEVLFKSQQKFKVTGFKNINGGEYEINLEEI